MHSGWISSFYYSSLYQNMTDYVGHASLFLARQVANTTDSGGVGAGATTADDPCGPVPVSRLGLRVSNTRHASLTFLAC